MRARRPDYGCGMTTTVFLAVLAAAVLHAGWNALVKGGVSKDVSMTAVVLGHVPCAALALVLFPFPAPESWPLMAASVTLHMGYCLFLVHSYRIGDLSQVYPIARGVAPILVTGVSVAGLGVHLTPMELLAVAAIAAGVMSLSLVRRQDGLRNPRAAASALATGCFIAGYSLVDGYGARLSGSPVGYFSISTICTTLVYAIYMAIRQPGVVTETLRSGRKVMAIGGSASFLAYSLVMWAFTQAPIPLVTALRETSILFALVIGVAVFREKLDLSKVVSTMLTLFGAALLRLAR